MRINLLVRIALILLLLPSLAFAAPKNKANHLITLTKEGKANGKIIVDEQNLLDLEAAKLLQRFIKELSNADIAIADINQKVKKSDIVIGQNPTYKDLDLSKLTEDGFYIYTDTKKRTLHIGGAKGKGSLYGVITLLDEYFGIHYLKEYSYTLTPQPTLSLPEINRVENPSFRYRQTQAYSTRNDKLYKLWHRLEEPQEVFAAGYWVHTFNKLLPAARYGATHPEYYAYMNGKRHPGDVSQWCLTNDEVFEIVANRVDSIFKANPDKHIISVSQNDSQIYCRCDRCQAILDKEQSPAGPLVYFVNRLAERFPDKEFSTLAYLFSVPAPKHIKPLPNVNIMLCDIDAKREVPLTDNASGQEFVKEMIAWSKITNNIFVWDYGINFDNYVAPFPNFHILQPNMKLFKQYGATMHFSQIAGSKGGDFSELRSYLVSKLLWNVDADVEAIIQQFLADFYGEGAAPYMYEYIKLREKAMLESKIPLWIYDTPVTHKEGMLTDDMIAAYYNLFDKAEKAVESNPTYLARIREERLTIQYSELEITRTKQDVDKSNLKDKADLFRARAAEYGVTNLNERNNLIEDYYKQYVERNLPDGRNNLALGSKVIYVEKPNAPYDKLEGALTDGLFGGATFNDGWVGWEGRDGEFIIDLGEKKTFSQVEVDFLHKLGAWVLMPKHLTVSTSLDNKKYQTMGDLEIAEDRDVEVKYNTYSVFSTLPTNARYIKIRVESIGLCPHWHYGVGNPAWFFIDEVGVF